MSLSAPNSTNQRLSVLSNQMDNVLEFEVKSIKFEFKSEYQLLDPGVFSQRVLNIRLVQRPAFHYQT